MKISYSIKNIEYKLKNNEKISDEDIASLKLIVYTDFEESKLEILNRTRKLFEDISERLGFDINEKNAIKGNDNGIKRFEMGWEVKDFNRKR